MNENHQFFAIFFEKRERRRKKLRRERKIYQDFQRTWFWSLRKKKKDKEKVGQRKKIGSTQKKGEKMRTFSANQIKKVCAYFRSLKKLSIKNGFIAFVDLFHHLVIV